MRCAPIRETGQPATRRDAVHGRLLRTGDDARGLDPRPSLARPRTARRRRRTTRGFSVRRGERRVAELAGPSRRRFAAYRLVEVALTCVSQARRAGRHRLTYAALAPDGTRASSEHHERNRRPAGPRRRLGPWAGCASAARDRHSGGIRSTRIPTAPKATTTSVCLTSAAASVPPGAPSRDDCGDRREHSARRLSRERDAQQDGDRRSARQHRRRRRRRVDADLRRTPTSRHGRDACLGIAGHRSRPPGPHRPARGARIADEQHVDFDEYV